MNKLLPILTLPMALFCLAPAQAQSLENTIQLPNGDVLSPVSILPNGDFSAGIEGWDAGGFVGARPDGKGQWMNNYEIRRDKEATLIRITCLDPDGKDFAIFTLDDIPLPTDTKFRTLLLSYRYCIAQLKLGELNYNTLRFNLAWYDAGGKKIDNAIIEFRKNVPVWTDKEEILRVPRDATFARFSIHFLGANGIIDITNLKLQPISTRRK